MDFSRKIDYNQRNLHDDFLEQLRNSTNDVVKGHALLPKNPSLMVNEGFYDKINFLRDVETSVAGMDLFR